ncbi:MAG: hypothetical protein MJZ81_02975 [Bacteroidales bacterium]|nr:hypothetical protein [Bacteroidales bacterium]
MKNVFFALLFALVANPSLFAQNAKKDIPIIIEDKDVEIRERSGDHIYFGYQFTNNSDKTVAYVVLNGVVRVAAELEPGEGTRCFLEAGMTYVNPCMFVKEMKVVYKDGTTRTLFNLEDYFRSNLEKAKLIEPEEPEAEE